jgi:predicted Zn-dependent protease
VIDQGYEVDGMTDLAGQLSDVRVRDGANIDLVELSHPVAIEALSVS